MKLLESISIFLPVLFLFFARLGAAQNPEVNTTSGRVIGTTFAEAHGFFGVRYAQPPIGDLRFMPPVPPIYSPTPLNTTMQTFRRCYEFPTLNCTSDAECDQNYAEDCLFLDVYVPSSVDLSSQIQPALPVMFWIHGGGFSFGSGTEPFYDSRWLANGTNTVVVNINYRLDALGALVYSENGVSFNGNQGIKDQQLALQWVYDNIENFGGNKSEITIFGESAGGQSVAMHLQSNTSRPLFSRVIVQSFVASITYQNKEQAQQKAVLLLDILNCTGDNIQCLRDASPLALVRANPQLIASEGEPAVAATQPYRPILDGVEFTQHPIQFFQSDSWNTDKKIIIGTTADENADIKLLGANVSREIFFAQSVALAGPYYGPLAAQRYLELAGDPTGDDYSDLLAQLAADFLFVCPSYALARILVSSIGTENRQVYTYVFDSPVRATNCVQVLGGITAVPCFFASHTAELPYIFNSNPITGLIWTPEGMALAEEVMELWGNFAHTGMPTADPNVWPAYLKNSSVNSQTLNWPTRYIASPQSMVVENYRRNMCDFWDSTGIYVNLTSPTTTVVMTTSGSLPVLSSIAMLIGALFVKFLF